MSKDDRTKFERLEELMCEQLLNCDGLSKWERQFVSSIMTQEYLSPSQDKMLGQLHDRYIDR